MRSLSLARVVSSFTWPVVGVAALAFSACEDEAPTAAASSKKPLAAAPAPAAPVAVVEMIDDEAVIEDALVADASIADIRVEPAAPEVEPIAAARSLFELEALFHPKEGVDYLAEGRRLLEEGKPGEAVSAFRHALYDDEAAGVWANLGEAYRLTGDAPRATACLEESLKRDPSDHDVRRSLVKSYLESGDVAPARGHVEVLARAFPEDAQVRYLEGKVFMKLSMWNEAIVAFSRSVEQDPKSPWARNNLGFSALMVGRDDLAVEHLEALLELSPVKPYMLNNLGVAYERTGRGPDAFAAFLRAVELQPDYTNALVNKERMKKALTEEEQELARRILDDMRTPPTPTSTMASVSSPTMDELE